ncbi:MAG: tRNA glutamyl-Q(34) synthetase GluQRS [Halieaceae bacterium MED-G27]|nr:tRNA glutamyl-Q(34) synthetase GluQRS [Halieaceae bacterium]OUT65649.1 MAG: tRNA glutamyl-Q(34) synthetase GluQRS [Cellvibrionales bacterium TMED21]PDH32713.1 MAG: tRNA glutamyl-Q(34) synthetase GluQRS [Halieaceae bacterium MED-G27]|tara:strand:+ start:5906 stop:6745 length:840 start_codon:yes stop_codon:yes gene_type:complete
MSRYLGRFAPSPTGDLHQGSLVAALASFLDARHHGGSWTLRFDDIDPPRQEAGSIESITEALLRHGLIADGPAQFQSNHSTRHIEALDRLCDHGVTFVCRCTRATLGANGACIDDCDDQSHSEGSIRLQSPEGAFPDFVDICSQQRTSPATYPANFVIRRRDGLLAYQLATAVDDALDGFTHVVRGGDLQASTHRQLYIQQLLSLESPQYGHIRIIKDHHGNKLSKQTGAEPISATDPIANIRSALAQLNQQTPPSSCQSISTLLTWAIANWDRVSAKL